MLLRKNLLSIVIVFFLFFGFHNFILAQEIVEPITYNPVLAKASHQKLIAKRAKIDTFYITSNKSFFDDFSQTSYFPKDSLWLDRNVFINSNLSHLPPSYGVATFDGLNEFGLPYKAGLYLGKSTPCDTLTSVPINLSGFQESDSLYLSFFYQPQGYGDQPDSYDSLVLEFKPDRFWMGSVWDSNSWVRVWSVAGSKLKPFKQVVFQVKHYKIDSNEIPIRVANYYHGGFQFRFVNYGNPSGNLDLWHLDYVYLNKGRNRNNKIYDDIAVVKLPQSLLKDYTSVPASHFLADTTLFRVKQYMYTNNLTDTQINVKGSFLIQDLSNQQILVSNPNSNHNNDAQSILRLSVYDSTNLDFPFYKVKGDTINLRSEIKSYYLTDIHKENDVASRYHEFTNYYAYDDGTAENGYSINIGAYIKGAVAYHFKLASKVNKTDSLRGISIYFNYSEEDASDREFSLMVWKKYDSTPIRKILTVTPMITDSLYNGFYTYKFEHPVPLDSFADAKGNFYIGWEQYSAFKMNVGLDRNYFELTNDSFPKKPNPNIYYYTENKWKPSIDTNFGALMMRPIISKYILQLQVGIKRDEVVSKLDCKIFPNPAHDYLNICTGTESSVVMTISDMQGREMKSEIINKSALVSLEGINPGVYIVVLTDSRSQTRYYHKLIIQK